MPLDPKLKEETIELVRPLINHFGKSHEHKAATLSILCASIGTLIAMVSESEGALLDGFSVANRTIREAGSEAFMKKLEFDRMIKETSSGSTKDLEALLQKLKERFETNTKN